MIADSNILNARFSFHWRRLLDAAVIAEIQRWSSLEQTPTVVIIGNFQLTSTQKK
jgi:hypothetical protein